MGTQGLALPVALPVALPLPVGLPLRAVQSPALSMTLSLQSLA